MLFNGRTICEQYEYAETLCTMAGEETRPWSKGKYQEIQEFITHCIFTRQCAIH